MTTKTPQVKHEGEEGSAMGANGADKNRALRVLTGVLLILTPIAFNVFFTLLSVTFEYPDILREPTGYVLRNFDGGGGELVAIWYGFMLTAVLFVPLAVLVHKALVREDTLYMAVATAFEPGSALGSLMVVPEFLWELSLGIWLIVEGFDPSAVASLFTNPDDGVSTGVDRPVVVPSKV
jgi:hypothetical protein